MKNSEELSIERNKLMTTATAIVDQAEAKTRELSEGEQSEFNSLVERAETLNEPIEQAKRSEQNRRIARENQLTQSGENPRPWLMSSGGPGTAGVASKPKPEFIDAASGRPLNVLSSEERLSASTHYETNKPTLGIGETILAMVTGKGGSPAYNANISGSDASGGYLVTPQFGNQILDLARSSSVLLRAGASTIGMTSNELHMVRQTGDVTGHWRREGEAITSSDAQFDRVTLRPKVLAAISTLTIELLEDASNAAAQIERSMAAALGLALDQAGLFGTGAEAEPTGIVNTTGVNTESSVATPTGYSELTSAVRQILTANYPEDVSNLSWLAHPRDFATYDGLVDSTAQPLMPTPWASKLNPYSTTSFSITDGGGAESSMIVGDFSQVMFGLRTEGVRLEIFREGSVTDASSVTHNAVTEMKVHLRAYLRADVAVMRPSWLTKLIGVTAA